MQGDCLDRPLADEMENKALFPKRGDRVKGRIVPEEDRSEYRSYCSRERYKAELLVVTDQFFPPYLKVQASIGQYNARTL